MRPLPAFTLAALFLLAGCAATVTPAPGPAPPASDEGKAAAAFLHDLSPMAHKDLASTPHALEHHRVPVREGVELDAYTWRPTLPEPVPVVLVVTPYYGGGHPTEVPLGHPARLLTEALVPRGYAVGFVSVTGTGNSGGCFTQGGPQEARDLAAMVDHFGTRAWSNGNVGLIGVSYDGTTPQETWVEAPRHLKSIVPVSGISDMYKYDYVAGVPIQTTGPLFPNYYWAVTGLSPVGLSGGAGVTDPDGFVRAVPGEACGEQAQTQEAGIASGMDGNKDAYWQARDFVARLRADPDRPRAPVLYVHGLQDYNVKPHHMDGWLEAVQESGVPFKALLGQWRHAWPDGTLGAGNCVAAPTGPTRGPPCRADWWNGTLVAWFDQTLKGRDTGILDMPAVQVQDDLGVWRGEDSWPPVDARRLLLHPDASGTLGASPGQGSVSYFDHHGGAIPSDPVAPVLDGPAWVAFVSEPVPADLRISGTPLFRANVTASGHYASLILTLAERGAHGERSFNFGAQSLNHVADPAAGRDPAGLRQEVTVRFLPSEDVVRAGSRIVLYAAGNTIGSDHGGSLNLVPVSDGNTIQIDLGGAWLSLPIDDSVVPESPQPFEPRRQP